MRGSLSAPQTQDSRREGSAPPRAASDAWTRRASTDYRAHGGYPALAKAFELGAEGVIREALDSKLQGRGGAAFPAGRKWDAVAKQPARPHYLVCNADESEPGTFKDRVLMEEDPFAIVEAMTIVAFATGCEQRISLRPRRIPARRGAHPPRRRRGAAQEGLLGETSSAGGLVFDIEVRRGAGAYICGEETALFNSIEGFRGEPRNKPPFPVEKGLFGKPTVINNVETLVNVLQIVAEGGAAFAAIGTASRPGRSSSASPATWRAPACTRSRSARRSASSSTLAGGVPGGRAVRAVLLGGAAGSFVGPDELDVPLTFEGTRAIGASLGSGVVMVFDEQRGPPRTRSGASPRSSATSPAASACPAASGTERQEELVAPPGRRTGR